ncbi:hypothetical protein ACWDFH_07435 [Streptomyces kronopolitis]|uniref:hypothetical protein n=1 Tax=Streptomyces TaxID=1883 RepID=UPI002554A2A7|nr:hypothetical protein [Streptomyces sp. NBRC 13847]
MRRMPRRVFLPPPSAVVDGPKAAVAPPVAEVAAADVATVTVPALAAVVRAVGGCG